MLFLNTNNIELFTYCAIQKNHAAGRWLTCLKYVWTWTVNILTWYIMYYCHPHLYWSYICGGNSTFFYNRLYFLQWRSFTIIFYIICDMSMSVVEVVPVVAVRGEQAAPVRPAAAACEYAAVCNVATTKSLDHP